MNDLTPTIVGSVSASSTRFSYDALEPEQAAVVQAAADAIRDIHKRAIPAIGRYLLTAKEVLPHGAFTAWAEQELGINQRSARNYMQAASWLMGKPATVAVLPPTVLYAISAPGVPDDLIQGVLVEAGSGARLNPSEIQAKLAAAKAEQAELKAAQRRHPDFTPDELRARKKRREQREAAERTRADTRHAVEKQERKYRLMPVVDGLIAAVSPSVLSAIIAALNSCEDRYVFLDLLRAAASGRQP